MFKHPILRLLFGLSIGFLSAFVTIEAIDRFGSDPGTGEQLETVLGRPDLAGYCGRDESGHVLVLVEHGPTGWRCSGRVNDLFSTVTIDVDEVCRWQFGHAARARLFDANHPEGWRCISDV